jgi:RMKL-like, methyltransferase domain
MPAAAARGHSRFFATCPAGLGRILRDRLAAEPGVKVTARGTDSESDYVLFDADRTGRAGALRCRLADGVFTEAGRASRGADPRALAAACWRPESAQRALSVWAEQVRPLSPVMSFRVTTRARTGPGTLRSGLRPAMIEAVSRYRPRWQPSASGELEIWLAEWHDGDVVAGLRLGGNGGGPAVMPAAVAAAMVFLAGKPGGFLFDPHCGSGTILTEAVAAGWTAEGTDVPAPPVRGAREGNASEILEPDDSVDACVTRLGPGPATALAEMSRVTHGGGAVIVLAADIAREFIPPALRLRRQVPVRLGTGRQVIWVFRRA